MSVNNQIDLIEFPAKTAEESKILQQFYSYTFQWKYKVWGDSYANTPDSGLTSAATVEPKRLMKPLAVLYSKNLDATKKQIIQSGGKILQDTYAFPGGRRFHFADPAGNELAVWSE